MTEEQPDFRGASPKPASQQARRAMDWPEHVGLVDREPRVTQLLAGLLQDLRFAARQLRKRPALASTAVLVFALSIGASTVIFGIVDAALVKPLPYREPSQLVALFERIPVGDRYHLSEFDYHAWKQGNRVFTSLDVYRPDRFTLISASGTEEVSGATVSDGFFRTLGVEPFLGRDFQSGEDQPGTAKTVILSYETWQRRFAGEKNVVGKITTLDGDSVLIVGVLPMGFHFAPVGRAGFWRTPHELCHDNQLCYPYYGVARLKRGVSVATAFENVSSIARQLALEYPRSNRDRSATVIPLADAILGDIRPTLIALLCGSGLLCLIGFVNISNLLLVRADSRRRETAVREALGASHTRLARQFAVEGFLLATSGCVLGMALTSSSSKLLTRQIPPNLLENMPYLQGLHFNSRLLLFAAMVSILGGILFSAGPSLHLLFTEMQYGLSEGGRTSAGRGWRKLGASLVGAELALTVVLLVGAGLLAKSFYRLMNIDIGISPDHLAILHVSNSGPRKDDYIRNIELQRQVIARMSALPGVTSVGVSRELALGSGEGFSHLFTHFRVAGRPNRGEGHEAIEQMVSVGYFETLRARLVQGRYFTDADDSSKPREAVINRTMAAEEFSGDQATGKRIISQYDPDHPIEIVGVVDDLKDGPLDMKPTAAVYSPFNQIPTGDFYVTLRTSQSERAVLPSMVRAVHSLDPGLIVNGDETMTDRINDSESAYLHRSAAWVAGGFAALALFLGTMGLYGVTSYSVGQRTREIGVRMALGAQRNSVYRLILTEAGWLASCGVIGGLLISLGVTSLLRRMLFGISPWDVQTMFSVVGVLVASSFVASYVPARRAASVNPSEALRAE
jgi:macrolide transport system ATP-binding/permease protein